MNMPGHHGSQPGLPASPGPSSPRNVPDQDVGAREGVVGTLPSRPQSLAILFSEALTVLLPEAPSGAGLLKVGSGPLCKLRAQIGISTAIVPKHLDPFMATRQNCFTSLESNKKKFFLACMLCPLFISFFPAILLCYISQKKWPIMD